MRWLLIALAWAPAAGFGQKFEFHTVSQEIVEQRLGAYVTKNDQREPALRQLFDEAGCAGDRLAEQPVRGVKANVEEVGSTDSEPFRAKKVPTITIHSLTQATLPMLHTAKDRIEAIHKDEYYRSYRLILAFLALLDQSLE